MAIRKNNPIKLNMLLNLINTMLGIVFPLITFPYASKVLGVENIGKYNFSSSIILYASLLAELGVNTYAIRECSKCRDKKTVLSRLANELFTINVISTIFAYTMLFLCIFTIAKLEQYAVIICILSINLAGKTFGTEWIFVVFEDYKFITLRTFFFQILSLSFLLLFVKTEQDLITYTVISLLSSSGAGVINHFYARKICPVKLTIRPNFSKHIVPIMVIFGMSATVSIYVASDTTILGIMCGDSAVGIYYVSSKIYSVVKILLSAILVVSIPRLSKLWGDKEMNQFTIMLSNIYKLLLTFTIPSIVGIIILSEDIILFLSTNDFLRASSSLKLLSVALFFCMGAYFWGQCVLVVSGKEKTVLFITMISALVNILLNILLIPVWAENAAALTTVLAEAISYFLCMYYGRKSVSQIRTFNCFVKILMGCIVTGAVCFLAKKIINNITIRVLLTIFLSFFAYTLIELLLKNEVICKICSKYIDKRKMR